MEKIIKDSSYADNVFLMAQDARTLKERFYRVLTMLNYYDMNIHEIFSNNSDLLNDLVTECSEMNIKLDLHPSLILKSSEKTLTSLNENNLTPPNEGQMGWEPTSSIETPPSFLTGDSTPPNLEIDLERDETPPKGLTDPLSDIKRGEDEEDFTGWIPSPDKRGEFFPTRGDNNPSTTPSSEASRKKKSKSIPLPNSDAMHFYEGEGENLFCTYPD